MAARTRQRSHRQANVDRAAARLLDAVRTLPDHVRDLIGAGDDGELTDRLRAAGWFARLLRESDPGALPDLVLGVAAQLPEPGRRVDRRTLMPSNPHALDGGPLPSLVLTPVRERGRGRVGWANVGADSDDLLGGLIVTGCPAEWVEGAGRRDGDHPPGELVGMRWQQCPVEGGWVFVTENPSVLPAAAALSGGIRSGRPPRVVCTAGTLVQAGWQVAVRADFDKAGLAHVRAILATAPDARPWRMAAADSLGLAAPLLAGTGSLTRRRS